MGGSCQYPRCAALLSCLSCATALAASRGVSRATDASTPACAAGVESGAGRLLEGVLDLLAGLLQVADGLLAAALGLQVGVVRGPAGGLLALAGHLVDLVADLVSGTHAGGGTRRRRRPCHRGRRRSILTARFPPGSAAGQLVVPAAGRSSGSREPVRRSPSSRRTFVACAWTPARSSGWATARSASATSRRAWCSMSAHRPGSSVARATQVASSRSSASMTVGSPAP